MFVEINTDAFGQRLIIVPQTLAGRPTHQFSHPTVKPSTFSCTLLANFTDLCFVILSCSCETFHFPPVESPITSLKEGMVNKERTKRCFIIGSV